MFVSGAAGIAAARALIESPDDVAYLAPGLRQDVVVYYSVSETRRGSGFTGYGLAFKGLLLGERTELGAI